jgi:plasmid stabilization system protein ParE
MISSAEELRALRTVARLEPSVSLLEQRLADLAASLGQRDAEAIDEAAANLQRALAGSIAEFQRAARDGGGIPPQLRQRLILAGGQVATLREAVARATRSLDRAIDVLLPGNTVQGLYGAAGGSVRQSQGSLLA